MWDESEIPVDSQALIAEINAQFEEIWGATLSKVDFTLEDDQRNRLLEDQTLWEELFNAINTYKKIKPWEVLADDQILVIQLPDILGTAYCSVLGAAGEDFGLGIYLGNSGLRLLQQLLHGTDINRDLITTYHGLHLSFVDREELADDDYQLIKGLGFRYHGRNQWPMLRSFKPGYVPWLLDQEDIKPLTLILKQVIEAVNQVKAKALEIPVASAEKWYTRSSVKVGKRLKWENDFMSPEMTEQKNTSAQQAPLVISELELRQAKKTLSHFNIPVEFSAKFLPVPTQDQTYERPYFPRMLLAIEQKQGMILYNDLIKPDALEAELQKAFLTMINRLEQIPREVIVESEEVEHIMRPVCQALSIKIQRGEELTMTEHVLDEMLEDAF
ncbi:hypothetical protein GCM10011391_13940 [Pullulanibacillus camelliae]|uniref:GNAT family N-acetyltransferase n=1 Tax=Pullulanibacillus camelliae TaxID=1707096 RepID=A0A8J2VLI3_9BACL|nr:hypothetical protein GCM10011391_13940 [Pullulanibacillus camelliae]